VFHPIADASDETPLKGVIPFETRQFTGLVQFIVSDMELTGPLTDHFTGMSKLETLIISNNLLTGPIPDSFPDENPLLSMIHLTGNGLSGPIPDSLADLPLESLRLNDNNLDGGIPEVIGTLANLRKYCRAPFRMLNYPCANSGSYPSQIRWSSKIIIW
jgi:hypothetical protein